MLTSVDPTGIGKDSVVDTSKLPGGSVYFCYDSFLESSLGTWLLRVNIHKVDHECLE